MANYVREIHLTFIQHVLQSCNFEIPEEKKEECIILKKSPYSKPWVNLTEKEMRNRISQYYKNKDLKIKINYKKLLGDPSQITYDEEKGEITYIL